MLPFAIAATCCMTGMFSMAGAIRSFCVRMPAYRNGVSSAFGARRASHAKERVRSKHCDPPGPCDSVWQADMGMVRARGSGGYQGLETSRSGHP